MQAVGQVCYTSLYTYPPGGRVGGVGGEGWRERSWNVVENLKAYFSVNILRHICLVAMAVAALASNSLLHVLPLQNV